MCGRIGPRICQILPIQTRERGRGRHVENGLTTLAGRTHAPTLIDPNADLVVIFADPLHAGAVSHSHFDGFSVIGRKNNYLYETGKTAYNSIFCAVFLAGNTMQYE
jgi:hypothetical protein